MAKYCPIEKRKVVYLTCQECEDKNLCKQLLKQQKNIENNVVKK